MSLFEAATREKMRFPYKGSISVEELWDLKVTDLDSIYATLSEMAEKSNAKSLLNVKSKADAQVERQIEIIRHIVSVKLKEAEEKKINDENRNKKQKLYSILAVKQEEDLKNKSPEEIQAMIDSMDAK